MLWITHAKRGVAKRLHMQKEELQKDYTCKKRSCKKITHAKRGVTGGVAYDKLSPIVTVFSKLYDLVTFGWGREEVIQIFSSFLFIFLANFSQRVVQKQMSHPGQSGRFEM